LSRAVAFAVARTQHKDVEIGINDNGFYVASDKSVNVVKAFGLIKSAEVRKIMEMAIEHTEVLKRRFRHCASRGMMILRNYKGHQKRIGRQQVSSMILLNAVRRIDNNFCILKEARREVLEDLMDLENAQVIKIKEVSTSLPSPFAFNLILQGFTDIMKIEDRVEFLRRMHQEVMAKISLKNKNS
jgi:ATP-dependent Lhr-like helicase